MSDYDDDMMYDSEAEDIEEPEEDDLEVQTENKYFEAKGLIHHFHARDQFPTFCSHLSSLSIFQMLPPTIPKKVLRPSWRFWSSTQRSPNGAHMVPITFLSIH
jgi:hypothetical protein